MTQVGYDARAHGQTAGTNVDGNESVIQIGSGLDAIVQAGSTMTFEATDVVEFDAAANEVSRLDESTTQLSGDKFSGMLHIESCPTPGSETRLVLLRNSGDTANAAMLTIDTSRRFIIRNSGGGGGAIVAGPMTAVGAGAEVRVNFSGDFSEQTAQIDVYTTDPRTSETPDETDANTSVDWNSETAIGAYVLFGVPHTAPALIYRSRYCVVDDSTQSPLAPLVDVGTMENDARSGSLGDGTTATGGSGGNTGGTAGDYFDTVTASGGGTVTFETDNGGAWRCAATDSGDEVSLDWDGHGAWDADQATVSFEVDPSALPTTAHARICEFLDTSDVVIAYLERGTDGRLRAYDKDGLLWTSTDDATGKTPTADPYRITMGVDVGTTTANGRVVAGLYLAGDGKTTTASDSYDSGAAENVGTVNVGSIRVGAACATGTVHTADFHGLHADPTGYAALGPLVSTAPILWKTSTITREEDYTASETVGTASLTGVRQSGPDIGTISIASLVGSFEDIPGRTEPVVIRWTVTDDNGSTYEDIEYASLVGVGSHNLVKVAGAWA